MKRRITFLIGIFLTFLFTSSFAENGVTHYGTHVPGTDEVIEALTPPEEAAPETTTRSLNFRAIKRPDKPKPVRVSISTQINFEYDSDRLTPRAQEMLHTIGKALADSSLNEYYFTIEGHTDATGADSYNQALSERRAMSVKQHLINTYNISPKYIAAVGRGENQLLNPEQPSSKQNRRVVIVNEGKRE